MDDKPGFQVTISVATSNPRDYCVHIDQGSRSTLMLHLLFRKQPEFDEEFMDELVNFLARQIASKRLERIAQKKKGKGDTKKAQAVVSDFISRMKKQE